MKKSKVILGIAGFVILALAVVAGITLVQRNQDLREGAAPATTLSITPTGQNKNPGDTFTLTVKADTGSNQITGVDLFISFNKSALEVTSVTKGSGIAGFSNVIKNQIDTNQGKILFSAFTLDSSAYATGSNVELLNISGKVLNTTQAGIYSFTFDPTTAIAGSGEGQDVLTGSSQARITVGQPIGGGNQSQSVSTSTPSPTPSHTPSATSTSSSGKAQTGSTTAPTASPRPSTTAAATTTAPTPTSTAQVVQATKPPVPQTGIGLSTLFIVGLGIIGVIFSLALAI